jgi:tetratricopeptide (TPR) repeat protein/2-polyprenyl-3-methyl-5-hydroxy-6-metoxy-1,4-benzoquinol methylase
MDPQSARAHLSRGNDLQAAAQVDEARREYQRAIACDPRYLAAHLNLGHLNYRAGEFAAAFENYKAAIRISPQSEDAFIGLANALAGLGHMTDAIQICRHAVAINPRNAEAHFNLGVLEMTQEHRDEAATSLRKAIELRPDNAVAHRLLGAVLTSLGNLDAAEASLRRACSIEPGSADNLYDLAMNLQYRGKYEQAAPLLAGALARAPTWPIKAAFANCAAQTRFTSDDPLVRATLTTAVTEAWEMPHNLCRPALSLIMLDERIAHCVRRADESWPAKLPRAVLFDAGSLGALAADSLLHALLEAVPLNSIPFERFLTCARRALLEIASSQMPDAADVAALKFYAALARQCFINEYVFECDDAERLEAATCRERLSALLDDNAPVPPLLLLAVAAYSPLHLLDHAERLLAAGSPGPIDEVLRQQVREPFEERALRSGIECLTPIRGDVSEAVRGQQNPYPRWVGIQMWGQALPFNAELRRALPFASFTPMSDDSTPEVLVAGCGTGGDAIFVHQRFQGARVLAIDLSLSSLSYAKRKTQELGLTNIEYAQADILTLGDIERRFDVIGAIGVLHHLADPFNGWRILLSLLRPGGFMCLGLNSQLGRRQVTEAREFIGARGYASTPDDIRRFRRDVLSQDSSVELRSLSNSQAFYSLSDCRDLAFNVQEQNLNLGQIESFLAETGLQFIGFELDWRVLGQYRARFADDPGGVNLRNWARFEADNPDTFTAMYRFWIQQPRK